MLKFVIGIVALGLCGSLAQAAVAPGSTGNGELFLNVVDETAQVSYLLDLGVRMGDPGATPAVIGFFQEAQDNAGYQRFWVLDSPAWSNFLTLTSITSLRWSVVAVDLTGGNAAGGWRLFTTVRQGLEGRWTSWTNANFSSAIGTSSTNFLNGINTLSAHQPPSAFEINADSVSLLSDPNRVYYGSTGGLGPAYSGTTLNATNEVGRSSWFYNLTRSGTSGIGFVNADEFDNGNPTDGGNDGYWGFVRVNNTDPAAPFYDPTSPYAGKYVVSFTMRAFDQRTTASVREFAAGIGRTEYSGGFWMQSLAGAAAAAGSEGAAGWTRILGAAAGDAAAIPLLQVSAVPEPGRVAMTLLGLAGVGALVARRRHQRAAPRGA